MVISQLNSRALRAMPGVLVVLLVSIACFAAPQARAAASLPAWSVQAFAAPTNFKPGDESGSDVYEGFLTNSGGEKTDGSPITIVDTLPRGLEVQSVALEPPRGTFKNLDIGATACKPPQVAMEVTTVTCEVTEALLPGLNPAQLLPNDQLRLAIHLKVPLSTSGAMVNRVAVEGGGAKPASGEIHNEASQEEASAGFEEFRAGLTGSDGLPANNADSHPYEYTTGVAANTEVAPPDFGVPLRPAQADLKTIEVALPPGLTAGGDLTRSRCTAQQFISVHHVEASLSHAQASVNECPVGSAVGVATIEQLEGVGAAIKAPLYNLVPPKGMPAQFGFQPVLALPVYIDTKLRSDGDYGVTAYLSDITQAKRVTAAQVTVWGTPADPSHDTQRGECAQVGGSCPAGTAALPFLRLPSSCADPLTTTMSFETWQPGIGASASATEPSPVGCELPDFSPGIEARPTSAAADSPLGLHFDLHLPQTAHEDPAGLGEADLREAMVTLPPGLLVNPSSADGLEGCSESQIGYEGVKEGRQSFSADPPECPNASRLGSVQVDTPLVDHPLPGSVYLAMQDENPFNSLIAIYVTVDDPQSGVVVKLPGKVEPDPVTGQLTTTVKDSPQLPFEDLHVDFFEGDRAPLRTPTTCGSFSTTTSLTPWTSPEGATATPSGSFQVTGAPGGGACPTSAASEPNAPSFEAGTTAPVAGAYSPLVVHLSREDDAQNFSRLNVTLPPGATGRLAGIPQCSEAQIAQAQARSRPGEGAAEQASPSCPSASAIGTVTVGAGAGPHPLYVTGKAYLAGPYEGAPFSAVFITPAIAGPFDLGAVVVRAGLYVNPSTAQVTTKSDPLPSILRGIPLDIRSITVMVDRPQFILNPTNCNPLTVTGEETSTLGQTAPLSSHFEVGSCQNLKFTPKFTVSTIGRTSKASGASLSVKVAYPAGSVGSQTNLGRVDLQLPKQLPARLSTLQKACTEAQFNANPAGCPVASMIGTAKAITPLLSSPLTGPAVLVSHGGAAFPDVEFLLQGEGVLVVLDGETQIKKGLTYSHFKTLPDQPISVFEATFPEGPYSVLATNLPASARNSLCGQNLTLPTTLIAQDGAVINQTTKAAITGCAKTKTLTRAQKLALALKACRKKHGAKRKACERQARRKYGPKAKRTAKRGR